MAITDKLIVTVAPTSGFQGKEANPAIPQTPEEIAEAVYECWNAGASLAHIHCRDRDNQPTTDPSVFQEVDTLIRKKKCDIIIQHSMAPPTQAFVTTSLGINIKDVDEGLRTSRTKPPPEMVSLELSPSSTIWEGETIVIPWGRLWAEKVANDLLERGIKPELEIYNNSDMDDVQYLIDKGVLSKPYYVSFVLAMHQVNNQASRYSPKHLMHLVDLLPPDSMFSVLGIGASEFQAATLSMLLGGNVRVGFEDNIYSEKGKLANSNAELVTKIIQIARALGREIAAPDEAREMLGIPNLER